jgi:uncharacterized damage-inducible protein DinB
MPANAAARDNISFKLIERWDSVCQKLGVLADELPASLFDYKPAQDVRTIAEVLRHVAFWNQYVADRARGKKADDSSNELPKEKFATKAQILAALNRSANEASEALKKGSSEASELIALVVPFIEHNCEHYGQLAVYGRLNGIVPPASRG